MRDIFVTAVVFASLPFILRRPWFGIIMWCWISYMNPHKQTWGFATTMPFALLVALATLIGMAYVKEPKKIPWTRETITLLVLVGWVSVTTQFALNPAGAREQWVEVLKIQLMTFVTMMLITSEHRLRAMIWMICLSLGYYGIKGGIFTIMHGGAYRVQGPAGTFIGGNNELALALVIAIPLMRFLQLAHKEAWVRHGLGAAMLLTAIAAIGSQSRGALLAIGAMGFATWLKSRNKFATGFLIVVAAASVLAIMPPEYYERMHTIKSYEQDGSAMGRINAWWCAWNIAKDRPLVGGGFSAFVPWVWNIYSPDPTDFHDVHSIYFEMLGEQGFIGLGLFLLLGWFTWRTMSRIRQESKQIERLKWIGDLASMLQASLIGYAVGGAFLGLAYFDLPYHLVAAAVIARGLLDRELHQGAVEKPKLRPSPPGRTQGVAVIRRAGEG